MSSRRIVHAKFQTNLHVRGPGELGSVLPSQTKTLNLEMYETPNGLLINFLANAMFAPVSALVPWANVVLATFAPEEPKKP